MKGYIVKYNGKWVVAEKSMLIDGVFLYKGMFYSNPIPIHPNHLSDIEQYEGKEVGYELTPYGNGSVSCDNPDGCECYTAIQISNCDKGKLIQYAIPNLAASGVDVWEEAWVLVSNRIEQLEPTEPFDVAMVALSTLEEFYTLTKI